MGAWRRLSEDSELVETSVDRLRGTLAKNLDFTIDRIGLCEWAEDNFNCKTHLGKSAEGFRQTFLLSVTQHFNSFKPNVSSPETEHLAHLFKHYLIISDSALVGMLYQRAKMLGNQNQIFGHRITNVGLKGVKMSGFLE